MSDTPNPYVRANEVGLSLGLAQADIIKFTDSFKRYDVNGNGFIDAKAAVKILEDLRSKELAEDDVKELVNSLDLDNNGEITLWEFVQHWGRKVLKTHRVLRGNEQPSKRVKGNDDEAESESAPAEPAKVEETKVESAPEETKAEEKKEEEKKEDSA